MLKSGESLHDLPARGCRIIQDDTHFRYGTDAVLLADFCRGGADVLAADLGAGTGALSLLLLAKGKAAHVDAVELQPALCDMACRSAQLNGFGGRMSVYEADLRGLEETMRGGVYDLVVCNPPYGAAGGGKLSPNAARRLATHETECTLADVLRAGMCLLRVHGRMCLCCRPQRLAELAASPRDFGGELKRVRFVHPYADGAPSLVLGEICRGGRPGVDVEPPLILYAAKGEPTEQMRRIYDW